MDRVLTNFTKAERLTMQNLTIAIVANDPAIRQQMREALSAGGFAVIEYDPKLIANLGGVKGAYSACLSVSSIAELEFLRGWRAQDPKLPIIVTGPESLADAAIEHGAYDFVPTASMSHRLVREVQHAVEKRQLTDTVETLRNELTTRDHGEGDVVVPLRELERRAIARALQATKGSVTKAAKLLGIGRATLYRRLASPELASLRPRRNFDIANVPTMSA